MTIAAKNSLGVFAACPQCHHAINHGFQVCQSCGHTVSAEQQQALRQTLAKNFLRYILGAGCVITLVIAAANQWLTG